MPSVTLQISAADEQQFTAALAHYEHFAQKNAAVDASPHKATPIRLTSQELVSPNLLEVTLEYQNEVDLVLYGMSLGILKANAFLKPYLKPGVVLKDRFG